MLKNSIILTIRGRDIKYHKWCNILPFNMAHLLTQEIVILSKCHILNNMAFWPQMSYYQVFKKKRPILM